MRDDSPTTSAAGTPLAVSLSLSLSLCVYISFYLSPKISPLSPSLTTAMQHGERDGAQDFRAGREEGRGVLRCRGVGGDVVRTAVHDGLPVWQPHAPVLLSDVDDMISAHSAREAADLEGEGGSKKMKNNGGKAQRKSPKKI